MTWMRWITAALLGALLAPAAPGQSKSQEAKEGDELGAPKTTLGYREEGPKHVQLQSFMAPVLRTSRKSSMMAPITVIMKVPDEDQVGAVCRVTPRVKDAMMTSLFSKPIPVSGGKLVLEGVGARLLVAINGALDEELVSEVFVLAGARRIGKGAIMNLPFASSGCAELD